MPIFGVIPDERDITKQTAIITRRIKQPSFYVNKKNLRSHITKNILNRMDSTSETPRTYQAPRSAPLSFRIQPPYWIPIITKALEAILTKNPFMSDIPSYASHFNNEIYKCLSSIHDLKDPMNSFPSLKKILPPIEESMTEEGEKI